MDMKKKVMQGNPSLLCKAGVYAFVLASGAFAWMSAGAQSVASAENLMVDRLVAPGHVGAGPCFSWTMRDARHGAVQTGWRIVVKDSFGGVVWDSGMRDDADSLAVPYGGKALASASRYAWNVSLRDGAGEWSKPAESFFETGLLSREEWASAGWIMPERSLRRDTACDTAAFVAKRVNESSVAEAWWTVSGQGVFEAYVNGVPVRRKGPDGRLIRERLKPGYTEVGKCRHAFTYDVTEMIRRGIGETNVFSAFVTAGWWRDKLISPFGRKKKPHPWQHGVDSAFWGVLTVRSSDGTERRFGTGAEGWRAAYAGPVETAGIYEGEVYDGRVKTGWMKDGAVAWPAAVANSEFHGEMRNFQGPPIMWREDLALRPKSIRVLAGVDGAAPGMAGAARTVRTYGVDEKTMRLLPGEMLVVDFGQNASAVPSLALEGAPGTRVTIRHAEMLNEGNGAKARRNDGPEGTPYLANLRGIFAGFRCTLGAGRRVYSPEFTYFGYRYLRITTDEPVTVADIRSIPVSSIARRLEAGTLETENPIVNRLISNVRWSQLSNYISIPTDCPQRDERLGWTADTQIFCEAATRNADVCGFLRKWLADLRDAQRPNGAFPLVAPNSRHPFSPSAEAGWADAGVIVPYRMWKRYGDVRVVAESWDSMVRYMDHLDAHCGPDGYGLGDWLAYELPKDGAKRLAYNQVFAIAHWVRDAQMMREMAESLGRASDAARFRGVEQRARAEFAKRFLAPDGTAKEKFRSQSTDLFMLDLDLCGNAEAREATRVHLLADIHAHGDRLQTGILGTALLLPTLTFNAFAPDLAYTLLLQREDPSWLYSVDQGATTIWERWNSYTKEKGFGPTSMNSFNHYAYGAVLEWMYSAMAGIRPDPASPGFRRFILEPFPDRRVGGVKAAFLSPCGRIESAWRYGEDGTWTWRYTIPANTSALVTTPGGKPVLRTAGTYEEYLDMRFRECVGREGGED